MTLRADSPVAARVPTERVNPLRPNISIYILHTFPYTFLKGLLRRNCLTINGDQSIKVVIISFIFATQMFDSWLTLYREIRS